MARTMAESFRLTGFLLGQGTIFPNIGTLNRLHGAILGSNGHCLPVATNKKTVEFAFTSFFQLLSQSSGTFQVLRDTHIFWDLIHPTWDIYEEIAAKDLQLISEVYTKGRKQFLNKPKSAKSVENQQTPLIDAVDGWAVIYGSDTTQELPARFPLTVRGNPMQKPIAGLNNATLVGSADVLLPSYLNAQEYAWIADDHIAEQLKAELGKHGRLAVPFQPLRVAEIPALPHNTSYPQDTKLFLCFAGLTTYDPHSSSFAVYMAPIGFQSLNERREWYLATGGQSKRQAVLMDFFNYAVRMIRDNGRTLVVGVVTHWMDNPSQYEAHYPTDKRKGQSRASYWDDNCLRYGLGLAVRKMPNSGKGYQLIVYDMDYRSLLSHNNKPNTGDKEVDEIIICMNDWRDFISITADLRLKDELMVWRGGNNPELLGKLYSIRVRKNDSVSHSCAWLWDAIHGHFPTPNADEKEMEKWGYQKQTLEECNLSGSGSEEESEEETEKSSHSTTKKKNGKRTRKTKRNRITRKNKCNKSAPEEPGTDASDESSKATGKKPNKTTREAKGNKSDKGIQDESSEITGEDSSENSTEESSEHRCESSNKDTRRGLKNSRKPRNRVPEDQATVQRTQLEWTDVDIEDMKQSESPSESGAHSDETYVQSSSD